MTRTRAEGEWLEFAADLLSAPSGHLPEERIAGLLRATFGLVGVAYHYREPGRIAVQRTWPPEEQYGGLRAELDHWGVHVAPAAHPVLRYYLATRDCAAVQVCDVPEQFADLRIQGNWRDVGGSWGMPSQLALPLHMGRHDHRAFVLGRPDPFTAGEMRLATTLQRLLVGVDRHAGALRETAVELARPVHLTARELAVLGLVAQGLTAAAVGRRLLIAERTVHKHLEHAYAKLDVRDRLGAVLQARRLGLLSD